MMHLLVLRRTAVFYTAAASVCARMLDLLLVEEGANTSNSQDQNTLQSLTAVLGTAAVLLYIV